MKKKALVGSVLQGATPLGVEAGVLMLALTGNHFHRDRLAEPGNREVINQAVQQLIPGARRFEIDAGGGAGAGAGGRARNHPAVQAALNVFQGEVRRRPALRRESHREGFWKHHEGSAEAPGQMEQLQAEAGSKRSRRPTEGGRVTEEANERQEIVSSKVDREFINPDDAQMLEDLVIAACNEALRKSRELVQSEMSKLTAGLKIPGLGM
jgi:DNA-binding protein YbaB